MAKNSGRSWLGSLARDSNQTPVQSGSMFTTADAAGSPVTSPIAVSASIVSIVIPDGAVEMVVLAVGADLRVSDTAGFSATNFDLITNGSKEVLPVARMQNVYLLRNASTDVTVYFRFTIV